MKEVHGVIATRVEHGFSDMEVAVRIVDDGKRVKLVVAPHDRTPGLTPEEARFVAKQLLHAAIRAEAFMESSK